MRSVKIRYSLKRRRGYNDNIILFHLTEALEMRVPNLVYSDLKLGDDEVRNGIAHMIPSHGRAVAFLFTVAAFLL